MAAFLHPGVYVIEVGNPPRAIEAASTSTAIFVGETERGPLTPTKLTSRSDYGRTFGGYLFNDTASGNNLPTLAYAMDAFFGNAGTTCYVLRAMSAYQSAATAVRNLPGPPAVQVNASSPGVWANGNATSGVSALFLDSSDGSTAKFRIVVVFTPLDTGVQTIVEDWDRLSTDSNDEGYVVDVLRRSLYITWDPNTPPAAPLTRDLSGPQTAGSILIAAATGKYGLTGGLGGNTTAALADFTGNFDLLDDISDASLLVLPRAMTSPGSDDHLTQPATQSSLAAYQLNNAGIQYALTRPHLDLFFIGSMSRHNDQVLATDAATQASYEFNGVHGYSNMSKSDFGAVYFPWIKVSDPVGVGKNPFIWVSPSATMCGLYARTDSTRGVWKAPAGVEALLLGAADLEFNIQDIQQDILNPLGINALRNIPGAGDVCWGARTMVPSGQWRYINVRRMAIFLRQSIYNGIQFAVFEGNDEPLWAALRLTIAGFMDSLYRQGAFAGSSPSEAYFVKCDAETTTPTDQLAGVVNVLVGFSPLRPAEFVVVKLSQIIHGGG